MQHSHSFKKLTSLFLFLSLLPVNGVTQVNPVLAKLAAKTPAQDASQLTAAVQLQLIQYLTAILNVNPMQAVATRKIDPMSILDLSQKDTTSQEHDIIKIWADMVTEGTLKSNITKLVSQLKNSATPLAAALQKTPQSQLDYATSMLVASIEAVVKMRGLTSDSRQNVYHEWSELSERMIEQVNATKQGAENVLELAESRWIKTEKVELLVDGPSSFAKREQAMKSALESIHILTWSIYDDMTGTSLVDLLLKKKLTTPQIKIRVIIDGQVAAGSGRGKQVARLEKAGIEVIHWFSKDFAYMGQHRKMLIVDNKHMIAGGLNYGDAYSHKNPAVLGWRDTDVYVKGAGAQEGNRLFAKIWNDQLKEQNQLNYASMEIEEMTSDSKQTVQMSIIDHDPRKSQTGSPIMLTILKAIRESKRLVDIENAYIILFPALRVEIKAAIKRGVKVRIFTNSSKSVDEPIVSIPILRSAHEFATMGAQVFLKDGTTLHSKILVVDSSLSMIMSYNLHPRSERLEGEMAVVIRDHAFAKSMHALFTKDVTTLGTEVLSAKDIKISDSPVSVPTLRLFFDML